MSINSITVAFAKEEHVKYAERICSLIYESDKDLATFGFATDVWKDDNMLSANEGWYDRANEIFFFKNNVHVMSEDQEGWCDSLYFYRNTSNVDMIGNAQVTDTTRNIFGLAGRIEYLDSISKVTMTRKPAVISETQNKDKSLDTVYLGAEKLVYYTLKRCDVDSLVAVDAGKRIETMHVDPVGEYRKKAAEEAAKAAEEAAKNDPNYRPQNAKGKDAQKPSAQKPDQAERKAAGRRSAPEQLMPSADSLMRSDSLMNADSLMTSDSLMASDTVTAVPEPDTTKIGFLLANHKVKVYKKDMQIVCDSLLYSDLDSLARFFKEPIIWQEERKQYTADSIYVLVKDNAMDKASLMSNAFISIQEDTSHYDQIKGTEMLAYFDAEGELNRFDVLGGASALFYIEENEALATVNKPESKMLSAILKNGEVQRIYYYDEAKNDGYPIVQLSEDELRLKGFNWQPEKRPQDRYAVTPLSLRPSQRTSYEARPRATYTQTDIYFPGYMSDVYKQIEVRDSLKRLRERDRKLAEQRAEEQARLDSLARADSLVLADSLAKLDTIPVPDIKDMTVPADSVAARDSLGVQSDSLAAADTAIVKVLTPEEIKAAKKAEKAKAKAEKKAKREAEKKRKQEALEAKWAEKDKRDAEKAAAKEAKRLAKERKRKRKALEDAARRAEREMELLNKYKQKFREKKARSN